jgi:hypothetical protein
MVATGIAIWVRRLRAVIVLWAPLLGCCVWGCTLNLDVAREQCAVTADCRARGGEFAESTCVDSFCVDVASEEDQSIEPDAPAEGTCERDSDCSGLDMCVEKACTDPFDCEKRAAEAATVTIAVQDVFGTQMANTPSKLCRNIDPECLTPVQMLTTDAEGMLTLTLPAGFAGYLEFVVDGYFPQLQFLPNSYGDGQELPGVSLSPVEFITQLGAAVGATPDPERGHLFLSLLNCYGPAEHLEVMSNRADDETYVFYVLNGLPSADLTETSADGGSGFLNFPAGNAALTVSHADTKQELAKLTYVVRAGYLTIASALPDAE